MMVLVGEQVPQTTSDGPTRGVRLWHQSERVSVVLGSGWALHVYHSAPDVADLDALEAGLRTLPRPYASFSLVESMRRSAALSNAARKRTNQLAKTTADWLACNALVVRGTGFFGAMVRGIMAAAMFLMEDHPQKVVTTVEEGAAFLIPHLPNVGAPLDEATFRAELADALALAGVEERD